MKSSQALAGTLRKMDERYLPYADAVMEHMATFAVAAVLKRDPQATRAEQIEAVSAAQVGLAQEVASGRFANSLRSSVESIAPVHEATPQR